MANARYDHSIKANNLHTGLIVIQANGFEFSNPAFFHKHIDDLILTNLHGFLMDVWRKPVSDDIIATIADNHVLGFYRTRLGLPTAAFYELATKGGLPDRDATFTFFVKFAISPDDHFDDILIEYGVLGLNVQKILQGTLYHPDEHGVDRSMDSCANFYEYVQTEEGASAELRLLKSVPTAQDLYFGGFNLVS